MSVIQNMDLHNIWVIQRKPILLHLNNMAHAINTEEVFHQCAKFSKIKTIKS